MQNIKKILLFLSILVAGKSYATFYTLEYPPFSCLHEQTAKGISIHFIKEIFKLTNIKDDIVISNWENALEKAKRQEIDGIFPAIKNKNREDFLIFPNESIFTEEIIAIGDKDEVTKIENNIEELNGKKICSGKSYSLGKKIDELSSNNKIIRVDEEDINDCITKILKKDADFFIADKLIASITLMKSGAKAESLYTSKKVIESTPNYLAIAKKSKYANKIKEIEKVIAKLKKENFIRKIMTEDFKDCL